ncbi:MAG: hypothetical protein ACLFV7_05685 [Phycisphaerae bacterium]
MTTVRSFGGDLSAVQGGQGVTEGKSAAQVPAGAGVKLTIDSAKLASADWLRIDTLTVQLLTQGVRLEFQWPEHHRRAPGWVQPGKDTLAYPLTLLKATFPNGTLPAGDVTVNIINSSDSPVILDNVRLDQAEKAPDGALLLDFGRAGQPLWPGFSAAGRAHANIVWSGDAPVHAYDAPYPDPLGQDFIGRPPSTKVLDYFALSGPGGKPSVAYMYVTHYGSRWDTQPTEYIMKVRGRTLLQGRCTVRDMLSAKGLLKGKDGDWTPKWFNEEYAPSFAQWVSSPLVGGRTRVDLGNCQIAAIAMAPAEEKVAMSQYMATVREQLATYRRQFVCGKRQEPVASLEPNAEETKEGVMLFGPDPDEGLQADWQPKSTDRVKKLQAVTFPGGLATFYVAAVPMEKSHFSGGTFRAFRPKEGSRALSTSRDRTQVWAVTRVPRLRGGVAEFVPFLLNRKTGALQSREIVHIIGTVQVAKGASPGVYEGEMQLTFSGKRVSLPLEIKVHRNAGEYNRTPTYGIAGGTDIGRMYYSLASVLPDAQSAQLTLKLRQQLMDLGFTTFELGGVYPSGTSGVREGPLVGTLKNMPIQKMDGPAVVRVGRFFRELGWWGVMVNSQRHRTYSTNLAKTVNQTIKKARMDDAYLLTDLVRRGSLDDQIQQATQMAAGRGKGGLEIYSHQLKGNDLPRAQKAFRLWILRPRSGNLRELITDFRNLGDGRSAYVYCYRPDRYIMGFLPAASGANGCWVDGLFLSGGSAFSGDRLNGSGLLVPDQGLGNYTPTLNLLNLWRAQEDFHLVRRAENLLNKANKAKVGVIELEQALESIRKAAARHGRPNYDHTLMRTTNLSPTQLDTLRLGLIQACAGVSNRLKGNSDE